jgi:hypothetical protein
MIRYCWSWKVTFRVAASSIGRPVIARERTSVTARDEARRIAVNIGKLLELLPRNGAAKSASTKHQWRSRVFKLVSAGLTGAHGPNTIIRQMLRPCRYDDIGITLGPLIDRYSIHGTLPDVKTTTQPTERLLPLQHSEWEKSGVRPNCSPRTRPGGSRRISPSCRG